MKRGLNQNRELLLDLHIGLLEVQMQVGRKAQGQEHLGKICVQRHSSRSKRKYNAEEKAWETRVRHGARKEIRDQQRT